VERCHVEEVGDKKKSSNTKLNYEVTEKETCKNKAESVSDKDNVKLKGKSKKCQEDGNYLEVTENEREVANKKDNETQDSNVRGKSQNENKEVEEGNKKLRKKRACAEKTEILKAATTPPKKIKDNDGNQRTSKPKQ